MARATGQEFATTPPPRQFRRHRPRHAGCSRYWPYRSTDKTTAAFLFSGLDVHRTRRLYTLEIRQHQAEDFGFVARYDIGLFTFVEMQRGQSPIRRIAGDAGA